MMRWTNAGSEHLVCDGLSDNAARRNVSAILIRPETTDKPDIEVTQLSIHSTKETTATFNDQNATNLTSSLRFSDSKLTNAELHRKYEHIGRMDNVVNSGDAKEHAHTSPYTRFDELAVHVVPTDDYGLSDIDGHKMG
jgi:hypothetical protein